MNDVTDEVRNEESNMSEMDVELAREIGLKRDAILEQVHKIIVGQAAVTYTHLTLPTTLRV